MPWITDHPRIQRIHRAIIGYICWLTIAHTHNNLHILHQFHVNHRSNKTAVRIKRKSCRKIVSYDGDFFYLAINWEQLCFFAIQTFVWQCEREKTYHIQKVLVFLVKSVEEIAIIYEEQSIIVRHNPIGTYAFWLSEVCGVVTDTKYLMRNRVLDNFNQIYCYKL